MIVAFPEHLLYYVSVTVSLLRVFVLNLCTANVHYCVVIVCYLSLLFAVFREGCALRPFLAPGLFNFVHAQIS